MGKPRRIFEICLSPSQVRQLKARYLRKEREKEMAKLAMKRPRDEVGGEEEQTAGSTVPVGDASKPLPSRRAAKVPRPKAERKERKQGGGKKQRPARTLTVKVGGAVKAVKVPRAKKSKKKAGLTEEELEYLAGYTDPLWNEMDGVIQSVQILKDRRVVIAARRGLVDSVKKMVADHAEVSRIDEFLSLDVAENALVAAARRKEKEIIEVLIAAKKDHTPRVQRPTPTIRAESCGTVSVAAYGRRTRKVNLSRGGKEGNQAFVKHPSFDALEEIFADPEMDVESIKAVHAALLTQSDVTYDLLRFTSHLAKGGGNAGCAHLSSLAVFRGLLTQPFVDAVSPFTPEIAAYVATMKPIQLTKVSPFPPGPTPVHFGASNKDSRWLKAIFEKFGNQDAFDATGRRPVHYAAAAETSECCEFLVSQGHDMTAKDDFGMTPLMLAARMGRVATINFMAEKGVGVDTPCTGRKKVTSEEEGDVISGGTALSYAVLYRRHGAAARLLELGASPTVGMSTGSKQSVLHLAAKNGDKKMVQLLLPHFKKAPRDKLKRSPMVLAAMNGHAEVVAELLRAGHSPNDGDSSQNTPLHYACGYAWPNVIALLLRFHADPSLNNNWNCSPVFTAASMRHLGIVRYVLPHIIEKIDIDATDQSKATLLNVLCSSPTPETASAVQLLIEHKADINAADLNGRTALHSIAYYLREDQPSHPAEAIALAKILVAAGADVNAREKGGCTALHVVCSSHVTGPEHEAFARCLIDAKADLNLPCNYGSTPLHALAKRHSALEAQKLHRRLERQRWLKMGTHFNTPEPDTPDQAPAITSLLKLLVDAGADINARDNNGTSILSQLCQSPSADTVSIAKGFLAKKADPNCPAHDGSTPLHVLAHYIANTSAEDCEIRLLPDAVTLATVLVDAGADVDAKDKAGWCVLCVLCKNPSPPAWPLLQRLIAAKANLNAQLKEPSEATAMHLLLRLKNNPEALKWVTVLSDAGGDATVKDGSGVQAWKLAVRQGLSSVFPSLLRWCSDPTGPNVLHELARVCCEPDIHPLVCLEVVQSHIEADALKRLLAAHDTDGDTPLLVAVKNYSFTRSAKRREQEETRDRFVAALLGMGAQRFQPSKVHTVRCEGFKTARGAILLHPLPDLDDDGNDVYVTGGETPLHVVAQHREVSMFQKYFTPTPDHDVRYQDAAGRTPLMYALLSDTRSIPGPFLEALSKTTCRLKDFQGRNEAMLAVLMGQPDAAALVEALIVVEGEEALRQADEYGMNLLMMACRAQNHCLAKRLLSKVRLVDTDKRGGNALHYALGSSDGKTFAVVDLLLDTIPQDQSGCLINQQDSSGNTPLHVYFKNCPDTDPVELVHSFTSQDVFDPTRLDSNGNNLLHLTVQKTSTSITSLMLAGNGVKMDADCLSSGLARGPHGVDSTIMLLMCPEVNVRRLSRPGKALGIGAYRYALSNGFLGLAHVLMQRGYDKWRLLVESIEAQAFERAYQMLHRMPSLPDRNGDPLTLVHHLAMHAVPSIWLTQLLKEALAKDPTGAEKARHDPSPLSPGNLAVQHNRRVFFEAARCLQYDLTCDPHLVMLSDRPHDVTIRGVLEEAVRHTGCGDLNAKEGDKDRSLLLWAFRLHLSSLFEWLVQRGVDQPVWFDVLSRGIDERTASLVLSEAVKRQGPAALHRKVTNEEGEQEYILLWAHRRGYRKLFEMLLEQGVNPNAQDAHGRTLLIQFARENKAEEACKMLRFGADTTVVDEDGRTALSYAVQPMEGYSYENVALVKRLCDPPSLIDLADKKGNTPRRWAQRQASGKVLRLLNSLAPDGAPPPDPRSSRKRERPGEGEEPDYRSDFKEALRSAKATHHRQGPPPPLHHSFGCGGTCTVVKEGCWLSSLMVKVDVKKGQYGINNFYQMQLAHDPVAKVYVLCTRWGRCGEVGAHQKTPFHSLPEAVTEWRKVFMSKTGNAWQSSADAVYPKVKGKYVVQKAAPEEKGWFDLQEMCAFEPLGKSAGHLEKTVMALVDTKLIASGLNHCSLSFSTYIECIGEGVLKEANELLDTLETAINASNAVWNKHDRTLEEVLSVTDRLMDLSSRYFELVPQTRFVNEAIRPFKGSDEVMAERKRLADMAELDLLIQIIIAAKHAVKTRGADPVRYIVESLGVGIDLVPEGCAEHTFITDYIAQSNAQDANRVTALYQLTHPRDLPVDHRHPEEVANPDGVTRRLLWHGTRSSNVLSVLFRGLCITPPGVPITGCNFGRGLYFADMYTKSESYTVSWGEGCRYLFLCDVALGRMQIEKNFTGNGCSENFDSVHGVGRECVDWGHAVIDSKYGCAVPMKGSSKYDRTSNIAHSEYIVYDTSRVRHRYLVEVALRDPPVPSPPRPPSPPKEPAEKRKREPYTFWPTYRP